MKRKISSRIFIAYWLIVLVVVGCCVLCYRLFFPLYYGWVKERQIREAYLDIEDLDLANLEEEDYLVFTEYEEESLSFVIADGELNPVYTTGEGREYLVYKNIEMKQDLFSETPDVIKRDSKLRETAKLRGIVTQNGIEYYVVIKDTVRRGGTVKVSEHFGIAVAVLAFLLGSLVIRKVANDLSEPVERLADVAGRIAGGGFQERAKEEKSYEEACLLAESINCMADQLRQGREQIEENRRQWISQNVRQERIDKMRKEFIANISHELKTPLAVIFSQTEMIENVGEEKRKYYLSSIQEETQKISGMASRLLDFSAMEHHMEGMIQKKLDMKEVMEYILMKYEGLVKKKHLHMEVFLEDGCFVCGDQEYIEQAVNNYMMNAIEHIEMGGNLRVTLKKQKKDIRVGVYNTGKQISEQDMERIWSGFYTTKQENAGVFSHVGLGLYIVKNVITMQDGKCGAQNLPEGVEFWFTMPGD